MSEYTENVAFIDLKAQQASIRNKIDKAISAVLDHGQYIMGPEVRDLECELEKFACAKHAIGCANGTDALTLVLMAWGVGPGDAIFVPSFTYIASAETPAQLGATPFFVDVDETTFNLDPVSFKQAIVDAKNMGLNPSVVIPVDLFGQPADFNFIEPIARESGIKILIDGAQSFGATYHGKPVGSFGDATTTSFFPAKPLGCYGDGGAVFTQDEEIAERIASIRLHGKGRTKYEHVQIGLNSRIDTIQAAILIQKLLIFPDELKAREKVAKSYSESLNDYFMTPKIIENTTSSWAQYTLRVENRDSFQSKLAAKSIPTVIYYPMGLAQQPGYQHFPSVSSGLPVSERICKEVISLPMHPYLRAEAQGGILQAILE